MLKSVKSFDPQFMHALKNYEHPSHPSLRNVAIVSLDASGKTALLESLLYLARKRSCKGAVQNQNNGKGPYNVTAT